MFINTADGLNWLYTTHLPDLDQEVKQQATGATIIGEKEKPDEVWLYTGPEGTNPTETSPRIIIRRCPKCKELSAVECTTPELAANLGQSEFKCFKCQCTFRCELVI